MIATSMLLAALAGLCLYLGSPRQRLWAAARPGPAHALGCTCLVCSLALAIVQGGPWSGMFSVLTVLMAVLVALPYLDAARRLRGESLR